VQALPLRPSFASGFDLIERETLAWIICEPQIALGAKQVLGRMAH
jgi:hypothetical protein